MITPTHDIFAALRFRDYRLFVCRRVLLFRSQHTLHGMRMRDSSAVISLDREGFALLCHPSSVRDFYDDDEVCRVYYPEAEKREIFVKTDDAGLLRVH